MIQNNPLKKLSELQGNTDRQLSEIRKLVHGPNEFNRDFETNKKKKSYNWRIQWLTEEFYRIFQIRLDQPEERTTELEDRSYKIIQSEEQKRKKKKNIKSQESMLDKWDTLKEIIYTLWQLQKEKSKINGSKVYLKQ